MMRVVLILSAAAVVLLAVLALTRGGDRTDFTAGPEPQKAPSAEQAAKPAVAVAQAPKAEAPPEPQPEAVDPQVAEDAAAVGLTTREPPRGTQAPAQPKEPVEKKQP